MFIINRAHEQEEPKREIEGVKIGEVCAAGDGCEQEDRKYDDAANRGHGFIMRFSTAWIVNIVEFKRDFSCQWDADQREAASN